jgi:hypothetical protein
MSENKPLWVEMLESNDVKVQDVNVQGAAVVVAGELGEIDLGNGQKVSDLLTLKPDNFVSVIVTNDDGAETVVVPKVNIYSAASMAARLVSQD